MEKREEFIKDKARQLEYLSKITAMFQRAFDSKELDFEEIISSGGLPDFIYAMGCVAPCNVFNWITGEGKDLLEFNHMANWLCFQNIVHDLELSLPDGKSGNQPKYPESDSHVS